MEYDRIYDIHRHEHLSDALRRAGMEFIPTDCVINKRLPGIGATHFELTSSRRSIIIEPNVPVIENKAKKHAHCLAVMQGVNVAQVMKFLDEHADHPYKLLTTPESFPKIKEAMSRLDMDMYAECFLLFDECEKLVQDVDFRNSIRLPMDDFFRFHQKAMISATPLIAADPRFNTFMKVLIRPTYNFRQKLKLIHTNNLTLALSDFIRAKREAVCIFCNSLDSIDSFFRLIPELQNSCTYCSKDGMEKLFLAGKREKAVYICDLKHYNFFTSRFFSAVDIECEPPHVVIISDVCGASQSVVDPKTEAIQIVGRFRKGVRSVTHITGIDPELEYQSRTEIDEWLEGASSTYKEWNRQLEISSNDGRRTLLREAMSANSYIRFLNENSQPEPFLIANYYEEQLVRSLYTDVGRLMEAYQATGYFDIEREERMYDVSDKERLAIQRVLSRKVKYEWLLRKFEQIEYLNAQNDKKSKERYKQLLFSLLNSEGEHNLYQCYCRYGAQYVRGLAFNDKAIRESVGRIHSSLIKSSPKAKALFAKRFEVGKEYTPMEAKSMLKAMYEELNMQTGRGLTAREIEKYARVEEYRKHQGRVLKIVELL